MRTFVAFLLIYFSTDFVLAQVRRSVTPNPEGKDLSAADSLNVKQLYFSALREKTVQNYQLAADMFKRVLDIDAGNDAAMYELANIYNAQNQERKAEQYIRHAVTLKPDNEWYWLLLADIYKRNNNLSELVHVFDQLIRLKPTTEDFYFDKANAYLRQNKVTEATAIYTEIENKFGSSEDLDQARQRLFMQSGKPGKAIDDLEKRIEDTPSDISNYMYLGEVYSKAGDHQKALNVLKKALVQEPSNPFVQLSLADVYRAKGEIDDSFSHLKEAFNSGNLPIDQKVRILLSFFPLFADAGARAQAEELSVILVKNHQDDPKAHALRGDVLFQLRDYSSAKAAYQAALKLNDQVYLIWEQLIRIEVGDADFKQVVQDGETALALFPNQAPLYLYTGIAYAQLKRHEKAISYLKNAASLELDNKNILTQIYAALGDAYNATKQYKESGEAYDKALQLLPDNTYALNNYAYYLSLRGENLTKAVEMSRRSNELEPGNSSFEDTLAWILFKNKNYSEARIWIEKSIKNDKRKSSTLLDHYGDILFHLGDKEAAIDAWKKAKAAGSESQILERKINEKKYFE